MRNGCSFIVPGHSSVVFTGIGDSGCARGCSYSSVREFYTPSAMYWMLMDTFRVCISLNKFHSLNKTRYAQISILAQPILLCLVGVPLVHLAGNLLNTYFDFKYVTRVFFFLVFSNMVHKRINTNVKSSLHVLHISKIWSG